MSDKIDPSNIEDDREERKINSSPEHFNERKTDKLSKELESKLPGDMYPLW